MQTNAQNFWHDDPATRARLRGVGGVHTNHTRTSFFRFVREQSCEQSQTCVMRAKGQTSITRHEREVEVFDPDDTVIVSDRASRFVPEVKPLILDVFVNLGDLESRFPPPAASFLSTRQTALCHAQAILRRSQPTRIVDQAAIAEREQKLDAHVDPNRRPLVFGYRGFGNLHLQADVPLAEAPLDDDVFYCRAGRQIPVELHFDVADVLHIQSGLLARLQLAPVSVPEFEASESVGRFEPWESGRFSGLDAPEESPERLVESA